jgi:hypothetical protein
VTRPAWWRRAVVATFVLASLAGVAGAGSVGEAAAQRLLVTVGPAVVHVRVIARVKATYQGQELPIPMQEKEGDLVGVVVDPSGLVLAGSPMGVVRALEARMPGLSIAMTLDRPRIRRAGESKELDAVLVAQDASLGLAYFQVVALEGTLPAVDFSTGRAAEVGEELYGVRRLDRAFDDAVAIQRCRVAGTVEQPRAMGIVRGDVREQGLPLFRADGTLAGVFSAQLGVEGAGDELASVDTLAGVLPLDVVRASLARA